jgi:hypothetical protein
MRYFLLLISLILLTSTLFIQEIGLLYRFSAGGKIYEWRHYGNQETDPKFMGEIKDGSPDGFRICFLIPIMPPLINFSPSTKSVKQPNFLNKKSGSKENQ